MDGREPPPDRLTEGTLEGDVERLDHGHLGVQLAGGGGHLRADEPGSHDDEVAPRSEERRDAVGVLHRAQVTDPLALRLMETARSPPGGQEDCVGRQVAAVTQLDLTGGGVDPLARTRQAKVDVGRLVPVRGGERKSVTGDLVAQVLLGQRWALVRQVRFGTDERDAVLETLATQGVRSGRGRHTATHQDDTQPHPHTMSLSRLGQ